MKKDIAEEYSYLTYRLDVVTWALKGECDDIDCNKYIHRDELRKDCKPVLEHNYSCMDHLKRERNALLRILSQKRYRKERYEQCVVCKKDVDQLDDRSVLTAFSRHSRRNPKYSEIKFVRSHKACSRK